MVVAFEGNGFRFRIYDEELLSDYGSTPISALENIQFDTYKDTVYDISIKASPSPLALGQSNPHPQSNRKNSTDVFRDEIVIKSQSVPSAYTTNYADVKLLTIPDLTFNDVVPGTEDIVGVQTFDRTYPQAPVTSGTYINYQKIAGTVSSSNIAYTDMPLSVYGSSPVSVVYDTSLLGTASLIIGSGTDFSNESLPFGFALGDAFVANNEYFTVESIANTTFMVVDRLPINSFSAVNAYRLN